MCPRVSPEAFARALEAAESLKRQLEERLIAKTTLPGSCNCCASGRESRVVGINIPTTYQDQIAMWMYWNCRMQNDKGEGWQLGISTFIPWTELYPMFRNHFAGIDVRVNHPRAYLCYDMVGNFKEGERRFIGSGRTVIVSNESAAYVRPNIDPANSVWLNAELRIDSSLEQYDTNEPLLACNVDSLEFGQRHGRGAGEYYSLPELSCVPTFYVRVLGGNLYFPIARVVAVTPAEVVFELDQSVESFTPDS